MGNRKRAEKQKMWGRINSRVAVVVEEMTREGKLKRQKRLRGVQEDQCRDRQ